MWPLRLLSTENSQIGDHSTKAHRRWASITNPPGQPPMRGNFPDTFNRAHVSAATLEQRPSWRATGGGRACDGLTES